MSRGCRIVRQLFFEIIFILLKAGMKAGSELCSIRSSLTARVAWRAVANNEIIFILLKAGMKAGSELCSIRRSLTVRVAWRAVANNEIILNLLKIRKQAIGHKSSKR